MKNARNRRGVPKFAPRTIRAWGAALALSAGALLLGCNEDEAQRAFRQAAASSLQSGVTAIATGLIDGAFAVFELGSDQTDESQP